VVSIHVNAAGYVSKWLNATGWIVFTCSGQTESDKLAEYLCESAIKNFPGRRIRTDMSDGDRDWVEDFYILRKSWCPAVLTENFFMDTHVEGIMECLESKKS
jgi:N-acetylmuramoyl-L-alanine amidase